MGGPATRITAADFLTPPEFQGEQLASDGTGRIGGVRVELVAGPAGTRLGRSYQQIPLRLLPPFAFGAGRPSLLYLLSPTAGLFDGDGQLVEITAQEGSRAAVVGQSATRIHPSLHTFSTQQWRIDVEPGAALVVLPGPAIPFRGCRYYQHCEITLAAESALVWGDLWHAGRYARGEHSERFAFTTLVQNLTIRRAGRLVFRDRFCWNGPWDENAARWHFGAAPACGSLFVTAKISDELLADSAAAFRTAAGDTVIRWCGPSEIVTAHLVRTALAVASRFTETQWFTPEDLAPAHWFTPGLQPAK